MAWHDGLEPSFAWRIAWLLWVAGNSGFPLRVTSGYRSPADQARLYQNWLAGNSPFPAAAPGSSRHEQGKAVDVVWDKTGTQEPFEGAWRLLGAYAESYLDLRWGGRFSKYDPIHFEDSGLGGWHE